MLIAKRSLLFALTAVVASVLLDLALFGGYRGTPSDHVQSSLAIRGLVHVAIFVFGALGALPCFIALRRRLPSASITALLGLVFGVAAPLATTATATSAGMVAAIVVFFALAAVIAGGGGLVLGPRLKASSVAAL
jgi:peptidoglycan/LPS O-acetylase OafA/YrhL